MTLISNETYFKKFESVEPVEIMPGFSGRFIHTQHMTLALWEIKAGSILPLHHHIHEQVTQLLSGKFELTVNDISKKTELNEVIVIPSNVPHHGIAITDCVIYDIFSPVRTDYQNT